jgi:hypothetical protein
MAGNDEPVNAFALGICYGQLEVLRALIAAGHRPNQRVRRVVEGVPRDAGPNEFFYSRPVHLCVDPPPLPGSRGWTSRLDCLDVLVREGQADINRRDWMGATALFRLVRVPSDQKAAALDRLLSLGADLEARDGSGQTAIFEAVSHGSATLVQLLISRGASVDVTRRDGSTPLIAAARFASNAADCRLVMDLARASSSETCRVLDRDGFSAADWLVQGHFYVAGRTLVPPKVLRSHDEDALALLLALGAPVAPRNAVAVQSAMASLAARRVGQPAAAAQGGKRPARRDQDEDDDEEDDQPPRRRVAGDDDLRSSGRSRPRV